MEDLGALTSGVARTGVGRWRPRRIAAQVPDAVSAVVAASCVLPSAYLAALTVSGLFAQQRAGRHSRADGAREPTVFAVCVPAHDEEHTIAETISALRAQRYAADAFSIHVVADNCSDDTACRARMAGAQVHERLAPDAPGKGAALNWLAGRLDSDPADVVVIVDADTIADECFLAELDRAFRRGAEVVQGRYDVRDPETSTAVALRYAALASRHHLRPLGRNALGASCGLFGNGMAFRRTVFEDRQWSNHLVEDAELQLELLIDGTCVTYLPTAVVRAEMPADLDGATSQNERWELGRLQLTRRFLPALVAGTIRGGPASRRAYADAAADQVTPPLSLHAVLCVTTTLLGGARLVFRPTMSSRIVWWSGLASTTILFVHVLTALRMVQAPPTVYRALRAAPAMVVWKVGLLTRVVCRPDAVSWTRTRRNTPRGVA